MDHTEEEKQ